MRESSKWRVCIGCHRGAIFSDRHMLLDYHYPAFLHFLGTIILNKPTNQPLIRFPALKEAGQPPPALSQRELRAPGSCRTQPPLRNNQVAPNCSSFSKAYCYFNVVGGIFSAKHFDSVMATATFSSKFVFLSFMSKKKKKRQIWNILPINGKITILNF